jgi:hypothetical protein
VSTLTTPPGTSDVATASASSIAASGWASDATTTTALPPTSAGTTRATSPSSAGSSGATTATTPVGSGSVKLKYGPATGLAPTEHLRQLVGPSGVPDDPVDRARDLAPPAAHRCERGPPGLHRLGQPVEDLPAVVRGRGAPRGEGPSAPQRPRRARPCARRARRCGPRGRGSARTPSAGTRRR